MKNLTLLFLLISIFFFSCKKNLIHGSLTVHLGNVIDNNYLGSILISNDEGKLLGQLQVSNNTIAEVSYESSSVDENIHLTLFEIKEQSDPQELTSFKGKVFTNISKSTVYLKSKEIQNSQLRNVYIHLDSSLEDFNDINISTRLMRRSKSSFNGSITLPDDDPNVFFAIMKEGEDFWRYALIPTNGETSLNITEADLIYQSPNVHFTSDININRWSLQVQGVRENGNVNPYWYLHSSSNLPQSNQIYDFIGETNLISNPEVFSKFRTKMELHSSDLTVSGRVNLIHVGEEPLHFYTPSELIPFQVLQNSDQRLKIQNPDDYSLFIAKWWKSTDLPNGNVANVNWEVIGDFNETFTLPEIPDFAKDILPIPLTSGNLPLKRIAGYKDSRYSNYPDFLQASIHNDQVLSSIKYPGSFDIENATIEILTDWF